MTHQEKKGKQFLYESFEDRRLAVFVGFLCIIYFGVSYLPETGFIAKILPFWPLSIFGVISGFTFVLQIIVWKKFEHFYPKWYRDSLTWLLLTCEFGLILFTVTFFSWPLYLLYEFIVKPKPVL